MKMPNKSEDVFDIDSTERWQHCVENTLRKTIIGLAVSSAALLLFPGAKSRLMAIAFGGGTGFGMGFSECKLSFEKNLHLSKRTIALVDIVPAADKTSTSEQGGDKSGAAKAE